MWRDHLALSDLLYCGSCGQLTSVFSLKCWWYLCPNRDDGDDAGLHLQRVIKQCMLELDDEPSGSQLVKKLTWIQSILDDLYGPN